MYAQSFFFILQATVIYNIRIRKLTKMENILPTLSMSYRTNTSQKQIQMPQNMCQVKLTPPVLHHDRYKNYKNNRSASSKMSEKTFTHQVHVQQLRVQDSKWLIFDSQKQELPQSNVKARPLTTKHYFSKLNNFKTCRNNHYHSVTSFASKSNSNLKQKQVNKTKGTQLECTPTQTNSIRLQPSTQRQSKIHKINFKKNKKQLFNTQIVQEPLLNVPNGCSERKSVSKSHHSRSHSHAKQACQSPGKVSKVSNRSQRFSKSPNKKSPMRSTKKIKSIKQAQQRQDKNRNILSQLSQVSSMPCINHNYFQIAEYLDPVQKLNPYSFMPPLTQNPYDDFPHWQQFKLSHPPLLTQHQPQPKNQQNEIQTPAFSNINNHLHIPKQIDPSLLISIKINEKENQQPFSKLTQNIEDKFIMNENRQNKKNDGCQAINNENNEKITKQTQKLAYSNVSKLSDKSIQIQKPTLLGAQLQNNQNADVECDIRTYFRVQEGISFIKIEKNQQTSYFPSHLKKPIFIKPNPDIHSQYHNLQIIQFLNLMLKVQPQVIQNIFIDTSHHLYTCLLYNDRNQRQKVNVDEMFPFDKNLYPLLGNVQQCIWFNVLMKAIAKLKQSFSALSNLTFKDIYRLITNKILQNFAQTLTLSQQPLQHIINILKQSKKDKTIVVIRSQAKFYKLQKIWCSKSIEEQKEQKQQNRVLNALNCRERKHYGKKDSNLRSLNNFINQKKEEISVQRMYNQTYAKLISHEQNLTISLRQLLSGRYQILVPMDSYNIHLQQ